VKAPRPVFFDTNVLVYLFARDEPQKQRRAEELFVAAAHEGTATVSVQVLQEFYVTATRKLAEPLHPETARLALADFAAQTVVQTSPDLVMRATDLVQRDALSLWDALVVEAARAGGCGILYTEDLQHGRRYGSLRVVDPFAG
jgi:predicted nucleic acid-binding protein